METIFLDLIKEKLMKFVDNQMDEVSQLLDNGLKAYTKNWIDKINNVKTFLFYENPVIFDKVYMPLSVSFGEMNKRIPVKDPLKVFFKSGNFSTILGHAGSGKTMLMKHCFLSCIESGVKIPLIVELRKLNGYKNSLVDYISEFIFKMNLAKNKSILNSFFSEGSFIILLDGYDEIELSQKQKRTYEIEEFVDRYSNNFYLLTSRPGADAETIGRFKCYHMCALNHDEIKLFVITHTALMSNDKRECDIIANKMLTSIFSQKNSSFVGYLQNPLLLSMFMLTFRMNPEIPSRRSDFYYNVFDTLYSKHDVKSKSGGYIHDRKCNLEKDDYQKLLKWFSYLSYFNYRYIFDYRYLDETFHNIQKRFNYVFKTEDLIYDLTVSISILLLDGQEYCFPHRSMQEYFAASLISSLPEDIKRDQIYSGKLLNTMQTENSNFWSLCEEMDEYCFKNFFLLPQLKEIYQQIGKLHSNKGIKQSVLLNFIKMLNIGLGIKDKQVVSVKYSSNKVLQILKYSKLHNPIDYFFRCVPSETCEEITLNYPAEDALNHDYYSIGNDLLVEKIFKNSELEKEFYYFYKKIENKIQSLIHELDTSQALDIDLLNTI